MNQCSELIKTLRLPLLLLFKLYPELFPPISRGIPVLYVCGRCSGQRDHIPSPSQGGYFLVHLPRHPASGFEGASDGERLGLGGSGKQVVPKPDINRSVACPFKCLPLCRFSGDEGGGGGGGTTTQEVIITSNRWRTTRWVARRVRDSRDFCYIFYDNALYSSFAY